MNAREQVAESWRHVLNDLWKSGLRIEELMHVSWDDDNEIRSVWQKGRLPVLATPHHQQKNATEESIPLLPSFERRLLQTLTALAGYSTRTHYRLDSTERPDTTAQTLNGSAKSCLESAKKLGSLYGRRQRRSRSSSQVLITYVDHSPNDCMTLVFLNAKFRGS